MDKPVHLRLSILELSKILIYEFSYEYVKWKYGEKHIYVIWIQIYIKTDDIYQDIAGDVETK